MSFWAQSLEEFAVRIHEHVKLVESMASHSSVPPCFCHGALTGGFIPCWDMLNGRSPLCEMDRVTRSSLAELGPRLRERGAVRFDERFLSGKPRSCSTSRSGGGRRGPRSCWWGGRRAQLASGYWTGDGERPLNESHDYSSCSSVWACAAEICLSQYGQTQLDAISAWLHIG